MSDVPVHCGNSCPFDERDDCPYEHWCDCCGDCLYCYADPCYDGCSTHDPSQPRIS